MVNFGLILSRNCHGTVTKTGENWKIYCKVWLVSVLISFLDIFLICRILQFFKELDLWICIRENKFFLWWRKLNTGRATFPPSAPIIKVLIIKLHKTKSLYIHCLIMKNLKKNINELERTFTNLGERSRTWANVHERSWTFTNLIHEGRYECSWL
jgi:hypothetical protein